MTTKEEIRDRVLRGFGYRLTGEHVATLSKDMRSVRLRHVWSDKTDPRLLDGVHRALAEYAQEIADGTRLPVEMHGKRGDLLGRALPRCSAERLVEVSSSSSEDFVASLPPAVTFNGRISASESVRRDLHLAVAAGLVPAGTKLWIRDSLYPSVLSIEIASWAGAVLAEDYATAVMEHWIFQLPSSSFPKCSGVRLDPPRDQRLSREVNETLVLMQDLSERRLAEAQWECRLDIRCSRLIATAERGLRLEVDPGYSDFMRRVERAATRLGRRAVRSICGEGGLDICGEQSLEGLLKLDAEARGRRVIYHRPLGRWVVA